MHGTEPVAQGADPLGQLRRVEDVEADIHQRHVERDLVQGVRPGVQDAAPVVGRFDAPDGRGDPGGGLGGGDVQQEAGPVGVGRGGDRGRDIGTEVLGRGRARGEPPAGGGRGVDPVHPVGAPVRPLHVPGHQVPPVRGVHQAERLHLPPALTVGEPEPLVVAAGGRDDGEQLRIDSGLAAPERDGRRMQGPDPVAQPRGQHLFQLQQGADRRLADAGNGTAGRPAEPDGHGHRLLVVQQQRWHRGAGGQPVAASGAAGGVHRVAEAAQLVDVPADSTDVHLEPRGQSLPGPLLAQLEQGEQVEQPGRCFEHDVTLAEVQDKRCPEARLASNYAHRRDPPVPHRHPADRD